jgi:hypothetical protein
LKNTRKNQILAIIAILLMASGTIMTMQTATAKAGKVTASGGTPDTKSVWSTTNPGATLVNWTFNPVPYISVSPSPIGVGQDILVNFWTTPPPAANRYLAGLTVTFIKPDGTQETQGPFHTYVADGTCWFTYTVDQAGNWSAKMTFPGQYFPAGPYLNGVLNNTDLQGVSAFSGATPSKYEGQYYNPAETGWYNFTVQNDQVNSWYSPLPTGYWTRPISLNNREWNVIAGNYPWEGQYIGGSMSGKPDWLGPYLTASNTAHIMWRRQDSFPTGIIGAEAGVYGNKGSATTPSVIFEGRAYATQTVMWNNGSFLSCAVCYDVRTGQYYYQNPVALGGLTPTWIDYTMSSSTEVLGGGDTNTVTAALWAINGTGTATRLMRVNPLTGAIMSNFTAYPGTSTFHNGYFIAFQDRGASFAPQRYSIINWTIAGTNATYYNIVSNISSTFTGLSQVDWSTGICMAQGRFVKGAVDGGSITAYSLLTGTMLYTKNLDETPFNAGTAVADQGYYFCVMENGFVEAFKESDGSVAWKSPQTDYPWGEFWGYVQASGNGVFLAFGYDGVYAFNWTTGAIAWHFRYQAPAFETPYTMVNGTSEYSFTGTPLIADGKLYIDNNEHTPSAPYTRGWSSYCVNMTDGSLIYKLNEPMVAGGMADGYTTYSDGYDGFMYVVGKGPSQTTISGPQTAINAGQSVILTGTVTDLTPSLLGKPCISDEYMGTYMSWLYLQTPVNLPSNVTGVPVSLDAMDPNGNYQHIGDTTSDQTGTYTFMWTPDPTLTGKWTVTASFTGSNGYGSSWADTAIGVTSAPASQTPLPTQTAIANPPYELYTLGMGIAIIAAIAVAVLILKKR